MFVRSIKMSTVRLVSIAAIALVATLALIIFIPSGSSSTVSASADTQSEIRFDKIKTDADRIAFLSKYGYTVEETPIETVEVTIPKEFDKVFAAYNELQKAQGLDLSKYKKKTVTRYTFTVTNYDGYDGTVYANVLVYRNRVIGGDICSADVSGFIHGFERPAEE